MSVLNEGKMPKSTHAVVAILLLTIGMANARVSTLSAEKENQLEDFIEALMACRANVGLSIAMVKDGETVFAEGFGIRDDDLPMQSNTKINIGSITKSFTATMTSDLIASSQGNLTWDTPLQDILGEEFELEGNFRTEQASFRDIYSHRLAMPNYWGVTTAHLPFSRDELCMNRLRHFTASDNFRNRYLYSNFPWVLGGYAMEQITGLTWEDQVDGAIFQPLGMSDTKVSSALESEDWDNLAYSYTEYDEGFKQNPEEDQISFLSYICPAGCIFSTAEDMAKYMNFHISEGQNEVGEQVIPIQAMRNLVSPNQYVNRQSRRIRRPVYPVDETEFTYGLGLTLGTYRGIDKIGHTGSYSSYNCRMTLLKEEFAGVWSCVNSPGDGRGSTAVRLLNLFALDILLDEEPWLNETTACTFPAPWETVGSEIEDKSRPSRGSIESSTGHPKLKAPRPLEDYAGQYEHSGFGIFTVDINETDSNLYYHFGHLLSGRLSSASEATDEFHMQVNYPLDYRMVFYPEYPEGFPLFFSPDENDNIVSVTVPYLEESLPPMFSRV